MSSLATTLLESRPALISPPRRLFLAALAVSLATHPPTAIAKSQPKAKPFSIRVTNSLRRPIVVQVGRRPKERVAPSRGTWVHRGKRPSFRVQIWVVGRNGRLRRIHDDRLSISRGNGVSNHVRAELRRQNGGFFFDFS